MKQTILFLLMLLLHGCTGLPKGVTPVTDIDVNRYLGQWHEIARLDHSFERGLTQVSAEYRLRNDGGIDVINRGYSQEKAELKEALGKAYFVGDRETGHLKVSFFGPFYGSYVIFGLDKKDYQYAYITGYSKDYLWLLARSPEVSTQVRTDFIKKANSLGFNTDEIIWADTP